MRIALVQHAFSGDTRSMREKSSEAIERLSKEGAEIVVLQELHENRYFCINESTDNFRLADDFDEKLAFWSGVAKRSGVVLVTSLFEKRTAGLYHNTAVVFERDGSVAGKYRKMHIPDDPGFYEKFYFTPGDLGFEPIDTSAGRLGVLVCWDQWFPEAARLMALKGAEILIYPTAIGWFDEDSDEEKQKQLDSWVTIQRSHAVANGVPVVSVNRVGFERDDSGVLDGIRFWGNSFVCGSAGEFLFRASTDEIEQVIEIDMDMIKNQRDIWPFFRDRRVEYYEELQKIYIDRCEEK